MSRFPSIVLYAACTLCLLFLSSRSGSAAEPPWQEIHSPHFTVITDAGEKKGREVALRFEQMRTVFAGLLLKDRLNMPVQVTVLALKNDRTYYQVAPLRDGQPITAPGFFLTGNDQDFIVLNVFEPDPWRAVAHDFALMLLTYNYPPAQGWFDEGLAQYFSSVRLDNRQVELGGDPELVSSVSQGLLGDQREVHPPKSHTELLGAEVWLSLSDLFALKHDPSAKNEASHHTLYYAESWMVIHYLIHEKKFQQIGPYFDLVLNQHVPTEDAIQKAFGMSSAQMEKAVKDYFHAQAPLLTALDAARQTNADQASSNDAGSTYRFPTPVSADDRVFTARALPEDDAQAIYAGIQTRVAERRDLGLSTLHALANTPTAADKKAEAKKATKKIGDDAELLPNNALGNQIAHRMLAWDHIQHAEFEEAFTELGDAAALNPSDMWVRYYSAVAKYHMAQISHTEMSGLPNMMLDMKAVLDWYPEMADAYDLLAIARNAGGGPSAAMQSERAAIGLSPRDENYKLHLAQIYLASKKYEAAQLLLDRLKASANPQIVTAAREVAEKAGAERKYGIPVNPTSTEKNVPAPQKSPFDVLEEDAAKRSAAEKSPRIGSTGDTRPLKFVKGRLLDVDCSQSPAAILTITAGAAGTYKLRAADYKSLLLVGANEFSCAWRDRQVTANYKARDRGEGDLVSLEVH